MAYPVIDSLVLAILTPLASAILILAWMI